MPEIKHSEKWKLVRLMARAGDSPSSICSWSHLPHSHIEQLRTLALPPTSWCPRERVTYLANQQIHRSLISAITGVGLSAIIYQLSDEEKRRARASSKRWHRRYRSELKEIRARYKHDPSAEQQLLGDLQSKIRATGDSPILRRTRKAHNDN